MNTDELVLVALLMNFAVNGYIAYVAHRVARYTNAQFKKLTESTVEQEGQDDLLGEAVKLVRQAGACSTSLLQRKFRIGYGRAARLIDILAEEGVVEWRVKPSPGRWVVVSEAPQGE